MFKLHNLLVAWTRALLFEGRAWVHAGRARCRGDDHRHPRGARGRGISKARHVVAHLRGHRDGQRHQGRAGGLSRRDRAVRQHLDGPSGLGSLYPQATPNGSTGTAWGATCGVCTDPLGWQKLPVHASGVMPFRLRDDGGSLMKSQALPSPPVPAVTFPTNSQLTGDWYVVTGWGDMDNNEHLLHRGRDFLVAGSIRRQRWRMRRKSK